MDGEALRGAGPTNLELANKSTPRDGSESIISGDDVAFAFSSPPPPEKSGLLGLPDAPRGDNGAAATFRNFVVMSVLFSAVHSAVLVCLSLATARLGSVGAWQSFVLYLTYSLSAVMGGTYVVKRVGSRNAIVLGMALNCVYVGCFPLATVFPSLERATALAGAGLGGIGSGILWIAQGTYFSLASEEYALESGRDSAEATSRLAGIFGCVLLLEETMFDVLSTALMRVLEIPWAVIFTIYAIVAFVATALVGVLVKEYPTDGDGGLSLISIFQKATAALNLLITDSRMKYMIGLNAAFGFAGGFLNGFISAEVVPVALNDSTSSYVGLLVAIHGAVAALFSLLFDKLAQRIGKGPILIIGSLAFGSVALPFLVQPSLEQYSWGLLILIYSAEGVGRATFEGTLKAVFADYFPYEKEGAFANIILQNGLSSALAYVLSTRLNCSTPSTFCIEYQDGSLHDTFSFAALVVGTSILAIFGFLRASRLHGPGASRISAQRSQSIATHRATHPSSPGFPNGQRYEVLQRLPSADHANLPRVE